MNARNNQRRIECGPAAPGRDALAADYQRAHKLGGVPPALQHLETAPMTEQPPRRHRPAAIATSPHAAHMVPALIAAASELAPPTHKWEK
jgi:hypothetical protein